MVALGQLRALLYDLDGTLVNSDTLHFNAFVDTFLKHQPDFNGGRPIAREFYDTKIAGHHNRVLVRELLPHLSAEEGLAFAAAKEARYVELIAGGLRPLPGLVELLDFGDRAGLGRALVTNAPSLNAAGTLKALGLAHRFPTVVLAERCERPKPHPAAYLRALDLLTVAPDQAIAFEDSPSGVRAAVAAGIFTVGILSTQSERALCSAGASFCVKDFTAPRLVEAITTWVD